MSNSKVATSASTIVAANINATSTVNSDTRNFVDVSGGDVTITAADPVDASSRVEIFRETAGTNVLTIQAATGTIPGLVRGVSGDYASFDLLWQYEMVVLVPNQAATAWRVGS